MPDVSVLNVLLYGKQIGTLTLLQGERTLFAFEEFYIADTNRPTLSLSFKDSLRGLNYRLSTDTASCTNILCQYAARR